MAKCSGIFDPHEWIWFVGGKAKGVKVGAYTGLSQTTSPRTADELMKLESTTQFIGCRGDADGKKTNFTRIASNYASAALYILETSSPLY